MRTVLIVLFDGVQSLDVTGPLEVFANARDYAGDPAYHVRTAGLGGTSIRTSSGLRISPDIDLAAAHGQAPDLLLIPGGHGARHPDPELTTWIRASASRATRLASVCTGAFILAEAGHPAGAGVARRCAAPGRHPRAGRFRRGGSVAAGPAA